jgi:hypothetical protein
MTIVFRHEYDVTKHFVTKSKFLDGDVSEFSVSYFTAEPAAFVVTTMVSERLCI